ncbi:MAG: NAD(P)/FAD-dependent oxidoreductase [Marmoricola sp.]
MANQGSGRGQDRHTIVVGAGMAGLSTAWFLQEHGHRVTVVDRAGVASGSSWGNAGWISPALTLPLNEPAVLKVGARAVLTPSSPVYVPPTASPRLLSFLARFAAHCTPGRWRHAMTFYVEANARAIGAYDQLVDHGVRATLAEADPFLAAFRSSADRAHLLEEMDIVRSLGGEVATEELDATAVHALEPALGAAVTCGVTISGQRYIDPGSFVHALADAVRARGGAIRERCEVTDVRQRPRGGAAVTLRGGEVLEGGAAVLASGAWLGSLARRFGVRTLVQAGRGYSFSVRPEQPPANPLYLPVQRVACTPLPGGRLRVAGMMEFRRPDAPLDPRRIGAIVDAARPMLTGVDWERREDEWVGSRPCTPDGLPLVGATNAPDVYVDGGHGMWGIALGPLSGRLLADLIATGERSPILDGFDPLR